MPESNFKTVFIFLDTDRHASPFDILTTIDVLPDAQIMKYENVTAEDTESIVHDIVFPRGPEGAKHTKVFINGHDFKEANEILEKTKQSMCPPFEIAVIIDPRGAYTTASAAVAKALDLSLSNGLGNFEGKTVTILAGTGPVGQTAARLYASEKAEVIVTSRDLQKASSVATKVNEELGAERVRGVEAQTPEDTGKAIENASMILSTGAAGTELLPRIVLERFGKKCEIVTDINAIQPVGVEGLEPNDDGAEILRGVYGIGSLTIGKLKNKIEANLIRKAADEPKGIFDFKSAYKIAKKIVADKPKEKKKNETETIKYWLP